MKWYLLIMMWISVGHSEYVYIDEDCGIYSTNIYPVDYIITFTPYLNGDQFYYEGEISIRIISIIAQNTIELDSKDLVIYGDSVGVFIDGRNIVDRRNPIVIDQGRGKIIINLREALTPYTGLNEGGRYVSGRKNVYVIKMKFRGDINGAESGLFAISYKEGNITKYVLSTRLSPKYASSVFPCIENPRLEAGYAITVNRPPNLPTVLSISKPLHNTSSHRMVVFEHSPQIPSYKFGLHLSEFVLRQISPARPHDMHLWIRRSQKHHYHFLLNFGNKILNSFSSYTNSSRRITGAPIKIVIIPNYSRWYEKGAWNLLTVGESKFLIVEDEVSALQIEQMEFELARQLARVWLGNPDEVSKTRWKEEWFKEGMATYFGYYVMSWGDVYQRDSNAFGLQTMFRAMAADLKFNRPLSSFNITSADILKRDEEELMTMKTASILRMIEHWLGSDVFHKAVKDYLNARHGTTISIKDFGDFLERDSIYCEYFRDYTVSKVISSWVNQPGYPVIMVNIDRNRDVIALSQQHFYLYPPDKTSSEYLIPIDYITQFTNNCINCLNPHLFMPRSNYDFKEKLNGGWIILNKKATGYYRVNYDEENWELIAKTLDSAYRNAIAVPNRAQIVNDAFALYAASLMRIEMAQKILGSLKREEDLAVWDAAFQGFELMKPSLTKQSYDSWKKFMSEQVSIIYHKVISQRHQNYQNRVLRSRIVSFACSVDLPACVNDMRNLQLGAAGKVLDPDIRVAYYLVKSKEDNGWFDLKRYLLICNEYERDDIMIAKNTVENEKEIYKNLQADPGNITMEGTSPSSSPHNDCCNTGTNCCTPTGTNCCTKKTTGAAASIAAYVSGVVGMIALLCLFS